MAEEEEERQEEREATETELQIQRILVALDASAHSLAALQAAANLAGNLRAQLIGLFVEDVNLLRLASLPFAQELCWPTASGRRIDEAKMERDMRLRAARARRALAYAAEQAEAEWSFRVVRGIVAREILAAAHEADLLSLGRTSSTLSRRHRLGSTALAAAVAAGRPVLLAREGADLQRPIVVTYDGSRVGALSLAAAARMAQANDSNLIVLIMAENPELAPQLAERASRWLQERVAHADYRYLQQGNGEKLVEALQQEDCGLVILGGESEIFQGEALQELLEQVECPVMVVR